MPRIPRVLIDHACYHIITRGNRKEIAFKDGEDYEVYLNILKKSKFRYKISVYAYCLMPNHVHILIEPEIAHNISKFMHWVNRGYAEHYNTKYDKVGHLWQGRFKSKPIVKGNYLIDCLNYIEANPVRANIVDTMLDYVWSSYNERCLSTKRTLLDTLSSACRKNNEGTLARTTQGHFGE